jgi:O-antigen/teichoic acid export membrane protein
MGLIYYPFCHNPNRPHFAHPQRLYPAHEPNRKEEHRNLQASAFVVSMLISLFIAACFLFGAPYIRNGLNAPGLDTMLYWGALTILVSTISSHAK